MTRGKSSYHLKHAGFFIHNSFGYLSHHTGFLDGQLREKFNTCVETVAAQYREMKILKLRKHWDQDNFDLVDDHGNITNRGIWQYWMSVDEAIEFWDHGKYKNKVYFTGNGDFIASISEQHKRRMTDFGRHRGNGRDRSRDRRDCDHFHWSKHSKHVAQVAFPPPPKK